MFENRVLRKTFGQKRYVVAGKWKSYIMRRFIVCNLCQA
jgi:hypothetical protein